jgi:exopolysaccharide biosynthesis predicted pyruvyltransferase EpsI
MKRFILIKRGGCKFTKKILNAQKRNYELAIIYDNDDASAPDVVMTNDGHGHLVDIPSIFISNADGKNLITTRTWCRNNTILSMQFETYTSEVANVTFWLNVNNRQTYITLRDFKRDYYRVIR